jgi:hypothetical protein
MQPWAAVPDYSTRPYAAFNVFGVPLPMISSRAVPPVAVELELVPDSRHQALGGGRDPGTEDRVDDAVPEWRTVSRALARDERQLSKPVEAASQGRRRAELVRNAHPLGEHRVALDRGERAALGQGQRVPRLREKVVPLGDEIGERVAHVCLGQAPGVQTARPQRAAEPHHIVGDPLRATNDRSDDVGCDLD